MALTKEQKKKWLKALRSGKYNQCSGALRQGIGFCCLGVLCDIVDNSQWKKNNFGNFKYKRAESYLPCDIKLSIHQQKKLAQMNDEGHSFTQIADYIDKNIKIV